MMLIYLVGYTVSGSVTIVSAWSDKQRADAERQKLNTGDEQFVMTMRLDPIPIPPKIEYAYHEGP